MYEIRIVKNVFQLRFFFLLKLDNYYYFYYYRIIENLST